MSKFTPGPWKATPNEDNFQRAEGVWGSIKRDGWHLARIWSDIPSLVEGASDEDMAEANARLMAAAPDLLAACKDIEGKLVAYSRGQINMRPDDFLERVRAAIAKAERAN